MAVWRGHKSWLRTRYENPKKESIDSLLQDKIQKLLKRRITHIEDTIKSINSFNIPLPIDFLLHIEYVDIFESLNTRI